MKIWKDAIQLYYLFVYLITSLIPSCACSVCIIWSRFLSVLVCDTTWILLHNGGKNYRETARLLFLFLFRWLLFVNVVEMEGNVPSGVVDISWLTIKLSGWKSVFVLFYFLVCFLFFLTGGCPESPRWCWHCLLSLASSD